jgi:hypothetical protein
MLSCFRCGAWACVRSDLGAYCLHCWFVRVIAMRQVGRYSPAPDRSVN